MTGAVDRFQSEMGGVMSTEYVPLNDGDLGRNWSDSEPDDMFTTVYRAVQAAAVAAPVVFLNEINYDTVGADAGEGIEIAGTAGVDLTGWTVVLYNGSNGASYDTIPLSGIIGDQQNGFGTLSFLRVGIQNGAPDGLALVDPAGNVVQFLSYEGPMTAANGPAAGMTSTDIGVSQSGSDPLGFTLQLTGNGTDYADFTWAPSAAGNFGSVNAGQSFGAVTPAPGTLSIADASVSEGNSGTQDISLTVTRTDGSSGAVSATWTVSFQGGTNGANAGDLAPATVLTGTVTFADGATSATITLPIAGDAGVEPDETFLVTLTDPTGGAALGDAQAVGTILNDDASVPAEPTNVFINEIHYDNGGTDSGEAIEIAGVAGTDLTGYSLVLYNGSNTPGAAPVYATVNLTGVIDDEGQGYGALAFNFAANGIQNGAADGFALIGPDGGVIQFLSYEGTMTAAPGTPAAGVTSTDIGVVEDGSGALGDSLQLTGAGSSGADFAWQPDAANSFGSLNVGQMIIPDTGTGLISVADRSIDEGDAGTTNLVFTVNRAGGLGSSATVDYAVALGTASADDLGAGAVLSGTVSFAEGQRTATITIPVQGDLIGEANETLELTLSNPVGNVEIVDATATGTITNDDPVALSISQIQGEDHRSAFAGQVVITTGIVTAVDTNGFYLQSATGDGNARTSDAIFVFTSAAPGVAVGDAASVRGTVTEFQGDAAGLSLTEITAPEVTVTSSGNALPTALLIGEGGILPPTETIDDDGLTSFDPATDGIDFWESIEGMRVTLDAPLVVSNTTNFGETDVVVSEGAGATGINDRGGITISPADFNPEKIQIDDDSGVFAGFAPGYSIGDTLSSVTGIVNYAFNNYEVVVTEAVTVTKDVTLTDEVSSLVGDATHLSLATYNVANLDPGDGARFALLAADIVTNLRAPDILAVQEIQDADGAGGDSDLSGAATAQALIDAIEDAGGPTYVYVEVAPTTPGSTGGEPGGNIRNGYLYTSERVTYVDGSAQLIADPAYNGTRAPLVASWGFGGETLTTINVHSTSRGGSDPLWGDTQPPANAGEGRRIDQAEAVKAYVNDQLATNPSLNIAVLGDFNGFYFEEEQQVLTGDGVLTNLNQLLPEEERYSYMFEGNAQQLDNILVTAGLYANAQYDAVHINSQFGGDRPTDHDPQLALFSFVPPNAAPVAADDAAAVDEDATTGNLWNGLLANDTDPDAGDTLSISAVDTTDTLGRVIFDPTTRTLQYVADNDAFDALRPGETTIDTFGYTVTDADGLTSTATVSVTITGQADGMTKFGTIFSDTLNGTAGEDRLSGLIGNDTLNGLGGHDVLIGGIGNDKLHGGDGQDQLYGDIGNDQLFGGNGDDDLFGGLGNDTLNGGAGEDQFHFGRIDGKDTISDFNTAQDSIVLDDGISVSRYKVQDTNHDGVKDLSITFSLGTLVTLLGVSDFAAVHFEGPNGYSNGQPGLGGIDAAYQKFDLVHGNW
jgi:VCBS repeat-containing protein